MKFENTEIFNFDGAIRGMRNSYDSWKKSDSYKTLSGNYIVGEKDMELMQKLVKGGQPHRKFLRQIMISVDITAPLYWWKEFDTYKVGTTSNSCSTMHTLTKEPITADMFEFDVVGESEEESIKFCEMYRKLYIRTKDKAFWRSLIQILPSSFLQKRTITMNYENVLNVIQYRKGHKLKEWSEDFMNWAKSLPYSKELLFMEVNTID